MIKFLPYRQIKIKKWGNEYRNIFIPTDEYKLFLRSMIPLLNEIYEKNRVFDCDHAFLYKKNCATNATLHVKNQYVLSLDIKNFFESISKKMLSSYVPENILNFMLVDGFAVQGFPVSPYLANIAMIDLDFKIIMCLRAISTDIVYSRYADDLTISFNKKEYHSKILDEISMLITQKGFQLNHRKNLLQDKKSGRVVITGIGVSDQGIHPTRKTLKKIRAAEHQKNFLSHIGLVEWSKCKIPK